MHRQSRSNSVTFLNSLSAIPWVDVLDILIVSFFFYALLSWLNRTATRAAALGAIALGVLYILARRLGMVLTTEVFHAGALVGLVALVVVFQEDVRRGLQRLPLQLSKFFRRFSRSPEREREEVELLVDVALRLAATKTGALLVLAGNEPLTAHLSSGIRVSGELNKELLLSIFHTGSPGHDGAVVVDQGSLWEFAAHLPLAHRPLGAEMGGTRHRAAVGLAERCDAMVLVVSEERGVISVAEAGEIHEMASGEVLRERLQQFFDSRFPRVSGSLWKALTANAHLKVLSVAFSIAAWSILVAGPGTIHRTFVVPIEYRNLPESLAIDEDAPSEARVTLAGPEIAFRSLDPSLLLIALDVSQVRRGFNQLLITENDLRHPPQLQVEFLSPRDIVLLIQSAPPPGAEEGGTDGESPDRES
ncbi:diadenylate cyclase [Candidatus Laterigemmans baculatus]|uniref:diadenylate cyclase n=1 Tax=Candidatus Laterigemmans baculatus TaxID=2770505 RepID=UPI0013D99D7E|nr:diadenylate cyclase [Candidatus Laterigemmans baculatus]